MGLGSEDRPCAVALVVKWRQDNDNPLDKRWREGDRGVEGSFFFFFFFFLFIKTFVLGRGLII